MTTTDEDNKDVVSAEEKEAEEQGLAEVKADELKGKIADDLGIDADMEGDLLDKLVERETAQREKLSKTIKQKISWREKAQDKSSEDNPDDEDDSQDDDKSKDGNKPKDEKPDVGDLVNKGVNEALEKRDLESLDLSEEIETEVKDIAKLKGISVRDAAKLPYIQNRIEEEEKAERVKNASPKRSNKGTFNADDIDPSKPLNPDDFDLTSKEGIAEWNKAKEARRKHVNS